MTTTISCPDCAADLPLASFTAWAAQTTLKTTVCADCGSTVTFPSFADGAVDVTGAPVGRGVHGTTREERALEVLASRPSLEQRE